jgi:hypothetical protein
MSTRIKQIQAKVFSLQKQIEALKKVEEQEVLGKYKFLHKDTIEGISSENALHVVDQYIENPNGYLFITVSNDNEHDVFFFETEGAAIKGIKNIIDESISADEYLYHDNKRYNYVMQLTLVPV